MKIIGIGETVFDIIFDTNNQPIAANPGGSTFNALISIGRSGVPATFISEVGDDHVGKHICQFLRDNGVCTNQMVVHRGLKSPLSLAFLDEKHDAHYTFYKDHYNKAQMHYVPTLAEPGDIILFGSYFAINPNIRPVVWQMLTEAKERGALLYYDINFRSAHKHELYAVRENIIDNIKIADIVKASDEDIENVFCTKEINYVYKHNIANLCNTFICTKANNGVDLFITKEVQHIDAKQITPISTIGAGDSFNAGVLCSLAQKTNDYMTSDIVEAIHNGVKFATEVCLSTDNYIKRD